LEPTNDVGSNPSEAFGLIVLRRILS
jgi:hypothetical protein